MRYKKDTKAKHVVSYTATRNLVKFSALNNLPVQCQRTCLKNYHCCRHVLQQKGALWLWTSLPLTSSWENWTFHFCWKCSLLFFSPFFNWGLFWLHVDRWCFAVVFYCGCRATNHIYIIILRVSTLWYIICSLFNHALVASPPPLSQSKFPITSCVSFSSWVTTSLLWSKFLQPPKMLKVPHTPSYFPMDQWNYLRNSHYRVVTKGIPLTTVVLYVEFIYRSSSFGSHLS